MLLDPDFDFFGGYLVVSARCLVVSPCYLVVSARYLVVNDGYCSFWWLLLVPTFNMNAATLLERESAKGIFLLILTNF